MDLRARDPAASVVLAPGFLPSPSPNPDSGCLRLLVPGPLGLAAARGRPPGGGCLSAGTPLASSRLPRDSPVEALAPQDSDSEPLHPTLPEFAARGRPVSLSNRLLGDAPVSAAEGRLQVASG